MSSISHTQQCNCNSSLLLNRAIALIDPSPFSEIVDHAEDSAAIGLDRVEHSSDGGPHDQCHNGTVTPEYIQNAPGATETTNEVKDIASNATSTNTTTVAIKKVRFSNSCVQQKSVSVHHVIEAYDILMHAASLLTSSINENAAQFATIDCDWKTLQLIADTFRALLIASCLLLELLPSHSSQMRATHPSGTENSQSLIKLSQNHKIRPRNECPIFHQKYSPIIPPFSPSIKKKILSTSRRCILSLQSLEKICAAKSIAQRHHNDNDSDKTFGVDSKNRNEDIHDQFFQSTSFYSGGDDIIDYERSLSDLHSDYDWHDDGFLPPPRGRNLNFGLTGTENKNDSYLFAKYAKKPSILRECCYRPQIYEGPPSSRYEKSAQTRDWIRGERIVSLRLEDYQYQEEFEPIPDNHVFELFSEKVDMTEGFEEDNIICDKHDDVRIEQLCDLGSGTTKNTAETDNGEFIRRRSDADFSRNNHENDECNDDEHDRQNDNDDNNDDDEGSNLFFHLSPAVLEKEEDNLWGIMFPGHTTPEQYSNNSTSKCINTKTDPSILQYGQGKRSNNKQKNMKNRQRKRRRRMEQKKALVAPQCSGSLIEPRREQFLSTSQQNDEIHNDSATSNAKEGFLLLIQDRNEDGTSACDDNSEIQARKDGKGKEYCTHTRVFVRLHPSGWLSIEDRSPRFIGNYAIDPTIDNGNISTYNQQPLPHRTRYWDYFIEPNTTSQPCVSKGTESFRFHLKGIRFLGASSLNQRCRQGEDRKSNDSMANLVFSVDDTTGGTFIDGYEWVVALSGAASEAKSLQDCILSEWEEDVLS